MMYLKKTILVSAMLGAFSLAAADEKQTMFDAYCEGQGTIIKKSVDSWGNPVAYMEDKEHDALTKVFWENGSLAAQCSALSSAVELGNEFYTLTGGLKDIVTTKDPAIIGTALHRLLTGILACDEQTGRLKCIGRVPIISGAEYALLSENHTFDFACLLQAKKQNGEDLSKWFDSGDFGTICAWHFGPARFMSLLCRRKILIGISVESYCDLQAILALL